MSVLESPPLEQRLWVDRTRYTAITHFPKRLLLHDKFTGQLWEWCQTNYEWVTVAEPPIGGQE